MRYGSGDPSFQRDSSDMGRYGLGMKTASLSQCRHLTVVSKENGELSARRWDLDHIQETGQWSLLVLDKEEISALPLLDSLEETQSGTIVIWKNLDRIFSGEVNLEDGLTEKMDLVEKHLALIFHRFLAGGDADHLIKLTMNGETVHGFDPFLQKKAVKQWMKRKSIFLNTMPW